MFFSSGNFPYLPDKRDVLRYLFLLNTVFTAAAGDFRCKYPESVDVAVILLWNNCNTLLTKCLFCGIIRAVNANLGVFVQDIKLERTGSELMILDRFFRHRTFSLIELLVITSHLCRNRIRGVLKKIKAVRGLFSPARGQVKLYSFTLIELLVVIAIIAILPRSKNSFFLPFSAI